MNLLILLLGIVIGFLFWKIVAGKYRGDKLEKSFRFSVRNYWIHIHHWLWSSILIAVLFFLNIRDLLLYGFLIGSIIQGLTYKDWYIIIYRKDKFHEIYSKFR